MRLGIPLIAVGVFLVATVGVDAAEPAPATAPDLCGTWKGCWQSHKNGHHGPMTATICRIDDCHYKVTFRGIFWKVFPFRYVETFTITGFDGQQLQLDASKVLGALLGRFECRATSDGASFTATFQSKNDCGVFLLERTCR